LSKIEKRVIRPDHQSIDSEEGSEGIEMSSYNVEEKQPLINEKAALIE
jgi:hypothetical protein